MFGICLFEPAFGFVNADRTAVTALGAWNNRVTVTTPQDIGRVVAEVAWAAPELRGVIYTAGATVSYGRVADAVARVQEEKGVAVHKQVATLDQLNNELESDPENGSKKYRVVFGEGKGVTWDEEKTFHRQRAMEMCGIEEWLWNHY